MFINFLLPPKHFAPLRINFHDELAALEAQNLKAAAASGLDQFGQTVDEQLVALTDSGLLDEEQTAAVETFSTDLQTVQNEFMESENGSVSLLVENLQNKFDTLMELLNPPAERPVEGQTESGIVSQEPTVQTSTEEPPTESPAETETVQQASTETAELQEEPAEEPNSLQQLVQNFQDAFQAVLDNLESQLTGSSALPPISDPSGSGKAYAKFMAIYEGMLAGNPAETDPDEQLDIQETPAPEESLEVTEIPE